MKQSSGCFVDNFTFRLHYQYTCFVLCLFGILVTGYQFFGDPILCQVDSNVVRTDVFETYCWVHGTFTVPTQYSGGYPHQGVGPTQGRGRGFIKNSTDGEVRQAWYQWVVVVLFFQAFAFYAPHVIWRTYEDGKLTLMLQNLGNKSLHADSDEDAKEVSNLAKYLSRCIDSSEMQEYVATFVLMEFLNMLNLCGQVWFLDFFLDGHFSQYGFQVFSIMAGAMDARVDPMAKVFPTVTKCSFPKFGPSGTVATVDGLCLLPLNTVNEKFFVVLWCWFILLAVWTTVFLAYRTITILSRSVRLWLLHRSGRAIRKNRMGLLAVELGYGDWFILHTLSSKMPAWLFLDLVRSLARERQLDVDSKGLGTLR